MNFKFGVRMKYDDPHRTLTFDLWRHHVRDDVKGQDYNDSSSVRCTSAHNSTTKHRRSTKNGRKVVRPTCDIPRQLRGQKSKVKVTRPLIAVTENQSYLQNGLRTTNLVYFWSMITCITNVHGDLQAESSCWQLQVTTCRGRGHIVAVVHYRPHSLLPLPSRFISCNALTLLECWLNFEW